MHHPRKNLFIPFILAVYLTLFILPPGVAGSPSISGVPVFPADHIWNVPADTLPVDARSTSYVQTIGSTSYVHADFGSGLWEGSPIGIPCNLVTGSQPKQAVTFDYDDESDPGPYPIPDNPLLEGGSDRHMLIIDRDNRMLYELFAADKQADGSWHAGSGAIFDLSGYELRPDGWTSADAAGLAILPGLVRYDEVAAGEITHAIRFTAPSTRRAYVWPARHFASSLTGTNYPPMGQRFRLKASFDTSGYPPQARVVLEAMKKYGVILCDNGGAWYITGVPDERWNNDDLHSLHQVKGSDFEAVDSSSLMIDPDSGQALTPAAANIDAIGVFRDGRVYLRNSNTGGVADITFPYGVEGDVPITGDWDNDGSDTIGICRNGVFYLRNSNTGGVADITFPYGIEEDVPITGDWDNDGSDTIGICRNGVFYLRNSNTGGVADITFPYGIEGDVPITGDWDNDGSDTIGIYRNGVFYLRNSNTGGVADITFTYGVAGDIPVAGDWDGDGIDTIGVYRSGRVFLRDSNSAGVADTTFPYGEPGDMLLVGNWDGA